MKFGIIIPTRIGSSRVKEKPLQKIAGKSIILRLVERALKHNIDVIVAAPVEDTERLQSELAEDYGDKWPKNLFLYGGEGEDPLSRCWQVSCEFNLSAVIRICHDKILIDQHTIAQAMTQFETMKLDYLYPKKTTDGSHFEIFSASALYHAQKEFKNVEHMSFPLRMLSKKTHAMEVMADLVSDYRFLVDYPEDLALLNLIFKSLGDDATLRDAIRFMEKNKWSDRLNKLPSVTVYTCAFNSEEFIEKCMDSVSKQYGFKNYEYLLVDDCSSDFTYRKMCRFAAKHSNVRVFSNSENVGLASSSNVALGAAKGKYIVRLDADDYFCRDDSVDMLHKCVESFDALYPSNYFGSFSSIQQGNEQHHVGGAIFNTRMLNYFKFTEGLQGFEGYDFFQRAKKYMNIGYLDVPTFFYTQRPESLSHQKKSKRAKIKNEIDERLGMNANVAQ